MRWIHLPLLLCLCTACDEREPTADPDLPSGADAALALDGDLQAPDTGPSDATPLDLFVPQPPDDAEVIDAEVIDAEVIDAEVIDAEVIDAEVIDAEVIDAEVIDAEVVDAEVIDADLMDAEVMDAEVIDAEVIDADLMDAEVMDAEVIDADLMDADLIDAETPPEVFIVGTAMAADEVTPVRVMAGVLEAQTDADGAFELGPLPLGEIVLTFSAPDHQREGLTLDLDTPGEHAIAAPMVLYRGQRVSHATPGTVRFRSDEGWMLWAEADALWGTTLPVDAAVELVPDGYEVFLGFTPDQSSAQVRRRAQPGLAGDIWLVPLDGGPLQHLFTEAQPWLRWVGDRVMAMVRTRDARSTLVSRQLDAPEVVLAEGVPWLLVDQLADGTIVWASGEEDDFQVYSGDVAGAAVMRLSGASVVSDAFLGTTPGRTGLLWLDVFGTLWRWAPESGAAPLADGVLSSPRPRFLPDGALLFWRAGLIPGADDLLVLREGDERPLVAGADPWGVSSVGDSYYARRPGQGLWFGAYAGGGGDVLEGDVTSYVTVGGGAVALLDGQAWRHTPQLAAELLGGDGLSQLRSLADGATAWRAEDAGVWFVPGPHAEGEVPVAMATGLLSAQRTLSRDGTHLYLEGADGWIAAPLPAGSGPAVGFGFNAQRLTLIDADGLLAEDDIADLRWVDLVSGEDTRWANEVSHVWLSSRRGVAAYTCDRGLFVVPLD